VASSTASGLLNVAQSAAVGIAAFCDDCVGRAVSNAEASGLLNLAVADGAAIALFGSNASATNNASAVGILNVDIATGIALAIDGSTANTNNNAISSGLFNNASATGNSQAFGGSFASNTNTATASGIGNTAIVDGSAFASDSFGGVSGFPSKAIENGTATALGFGTTAESYGDAWAVVGSTSKATHNATATGGRIEPDPLSCLFASCTFTPSSAFSSADATSGFFSKADSVANATATDSGGCPAGGCTYANALGSVDFQNPTPGAVANSTASACDPTGPFGGGNCYASAVSNANANDSVAAVAGSIGISGTGGTAAAKSTSNATNDAVAALSDAVAVGTNNGDASAVANSQNQAGLKADSFSQAIAPNNGQALANSLSVTRAGAATSAALADSTVSAGDSGFAATRSLGCEVMSNCGSALGFAAANQGVGVSGVSSVALAGNNAAVNSAANVVASNGGNAPAQTHISMNLTPQSWSHNVTYTSGASTATSTVSTFVP
jgi:hypothetical protein